LKQLRTTIFFCFNLFFFIFFSLISFSSFLSRQTTQQLNWQRMTEFLFFIFSAKPTPKSQFLLRRFEFFHLILKNSAQKKGMFLFVF